MKILRYILLASLTCALSACEKDEILPEPEPPVVTPGDDDGPEGDDPGKDEEEKIFEKSDIQNRQYGRA